MGTVTKTIGTTGRDYSTLQAWEDALPANLVTDGNYQVGQCFNDSEFSGTGVQLTISGQTTDATHTITLTTGTGQSFRDHASVQTNALRYNQSNGVGIRRTDNYNEAVSVATNYVTLSGLQISGDANTRAVSTTDNVTTNTIIEFCILESIRVGTDGNGATLKLNDSTSVIRNCLVTSRTDSSGSGINLNYGASAYNVTVAKPSDKTAAVQAFLRSYGTPLVKNCSGFGFTDFTNADAQFSGSSANNCTSDATAPGTSNQVSKTYANQFVTTTDSARDFRLKTGADCADNGVTDTTHGPIDIAKTSRPSGSAYDIGCWELVVAAGDVLLACNN